MIGFFYGQTEYTYLQNSIKLEDYVKHVVDYEYDFVTIADSNMHGYYKFYKLCIQYNIKGVIGLKIKINDSYYLIYAKNDNGIKLLYDLTLIQEETNNIPIEKLYNTKEDIFMVSIQSESFINCSTDTILKSINKLLNNNIDFYYGVNSSNDIIPNTKYLPISRTSYLDKEDKKVLNTLRKIGNFNEEVNDCYLKSKEELNANFKDIELDFSTVISNIEYNLFKEEISLPTYDNNIDSSDNYLKELTLKGLKKRLTTLDKLDKYSIYEQRVLYELNIISSMKYSDYFLIVWDFIKYSKQNGILVGPGRGSSAGCLVSFCIGITEIDPIQYDLLFERFLNPNRITLPDIDLDFPDNKREQVIQYVKDKYSKDNVCYISAFNTFGVKSSIRDICRVNNVSTEHINLLVNNIDKFGIDETIQKYSSIEELKDVLIIAKKMNGLVRHISTHAAGIILSSNKLNSLIPLKVGINDIYQSQLEAYDLEERGFLKIDFLGIRNLTVLDNMCNMIPNFNINTITLNDYNTYNLLKKGDTLGIFQLESSGIKSVLRTMSPDNFLDIVSVLALYRPGPMDNIPLFIERKNNSKFEYTHPKLEPILKSTYGVIVYQEQIMQILNVVSNYTYAEADLLRRAISKKNKQVLDDSRKEFISRACNNNFDLNIANDIYDLIVRFADYGFNKSHSVAYAKLSYQMSYIKANYPIVFITCMINNVLGDQKELLNYINYAKSLGIEVVTPKINHSTNEAYIIKNKILLPFQVIKKFGAHTAKELLKIRETPFKDYDDFLGRCNNIIKEYTIESMIYCNTLDEFKLTKKTMVEKSDADPTFQKYLLDKVVSKDEYSFTELKNKELEHLGFNINYDLFKINYEKLSKLQYVKTLDDIKEGVVKSFVCFISDIRVIETKNKEQMAFVDLDLQFINLTGVLFPKAYISISNVDLSNLVYISANVQKRNEELQLVINNIKNI